MKMENESSRQIRNLLKESGVGDITGRLPTLSEMARLRHASEALSKMLLPEMPGAEEIAKALGLQKTNAADLAKQWLLSGKPPAVWEQFIDKKEEEES